VLSVGCNPACTDEQKKQNDPEDIYFFFVCGLVNSDFKIRDHTAVNGKMTISNEMEGMRKEVAVD
jgi:hypothetical protein